MSLLAYIAIFYVLVFHNVPEADFLFYTFHIMMWLWHGIHIFYYALRFSLKKLFDKFSTFFMPISQIFMRPESHFGNFLGIYDKVRDYF